MKRNTTGDVAVLFDLEDTLVKTPWSIREHVLEFRQDTRAKLASLGVPSFVIEGVERSTVMRNNASAYVEQSFSKKEAERFRREMGFFSGVMSWTRRRNLRFFRIAFLRLKQ